MNDAPIRVLLIEDDLAYADLLRQALASVRFAEFSVTSAESLAQARAVLSKESFDAALVDLMLPDAHGLDAFVALQADAPGLPVVILTGVEDEGQALEAVRRGAQEYLVKGEVEAAMLARLVRYAIERQRVERSLRESHESFRLIWESLSDLVAVIGLDGKRLYNSPSYKSVLGDPAKLLGTDSFAEIHPDDRERVQRLFRQTIDTGQGQEAEFRFLLEDGTVRHMESRGSLIRDAEGRPSKVLVVSRDVTQRKQAEQELRERQEFSRLILENVSDLVALLDRDGRRLYNNPAYRALLGDPDAMRGTDSFAEVHPEDRVRIQEVFQETIRTGVGQRAEYRFLCKDGSVRHVESVGSVIKDDAGRPAKVVVLSRDITARKQAERLLAIQYATTRALAESRTLAEAAPKILAVVCEQLEWQAGAYWRLDAQARVLRCLEFWSAPGVLAAEFKDVTQRITFASGVGLPGRVWSGGQPAWIPDVSRDANLPRAPFALQAGLRAAFGFPVRAGAELIGVMEFFSRRIQRPDQELLQLFGAIGQQIGQFVARKRSEEALADERQLLRTLIDNLPDCIYVKDTASRFLINNVAHARTLGAADPREIVGKWDFDFFPRELAERYYADEQNVIATGRPLVNREEPVVDAAGGRLWVLTTKVPLFDDAQRIIGIVGMTRDITDRKRVEEERRLSEARLQAILDNTTAVIFLKDPQGRYLLVNRRFEELFNVTRQQVVGKLDTDLFPPALAAVYRRHDEQVLAARTALEFEEAAPHGAETHSYVSVKVPLCDAAGVPYAICGIATDITEIKRAEEKLRLAYSELAAREEELRQAMTELSRSHQELKTTQQSLIQAAKLESVGTLAAGVAHEVKNPLQTIIMGLDYLAKNVPPGNENMTLVTTDMRTAVKRADQIVRGLLHFASANQADARADDLNAIVRQALLLVNYELTRAHITVTQDLQPNLPPVRVDRVKMEQVFINLFMNAIHAMADGGELTVRTWTRRAEDSEELARLGGPGGNFPPAAALVVAEIKDTGRGIDPEHLPKVFDPFFTTKPSGVGSGLGLPVTRKIIELHGGVLELKNDPTGGVRVTLILKGEDAAR